jgi:glycosyltransferase involved in cell wall biosynthesis
MHAEKKISIIIPTFNAEIYINSLINNLIEYRKTLLELNIPVEIIFILDKCTDKTESILNENKNRLKYLIVMNEHNNGPSYCRNLGLKISNGEFVIFLDSDDLLDLNFAKKMALYLQDDLDILIGNYLINDKSSITLRSHGVNYQDKLLSNKDIFKNILNYCTEPYIYTLFVHCWGKVYNKKFLINNHIQFNEKINQLEDVNFNIICLINQPKIKYVNATMYVYMKSSSSNNLSLLSGAQSKHIKGVIKALYHLKKLFLNNNCSIQESKFYRQHLYATLFILWVIRASKNSKNFLSAYKIIRRYSSTTYVVFSMKRYLKLSSNDKVLPFFLKFKLAFFATLYCRLFK